MPWITVEAVSGRSIQQKREVSARITEAFIEVYGIPAENVTVRFYDTEPQNLSKAGVLVSDQRRAAANNAGLPESSS